MEQCDSKGCGAPAVFWGHCEAHLTEKERAVLKLIDAAEKAACRDELPVGFKRGLLDAIAAVKEQP